MNTSIVLSLDKRRARKDGAFPLIYRLTHLRKTTSIKTGYWIPSAFWDEKNRKIRSTYKGSESPTRLNNQLQKKIASMMDIIGKLDENKELPYISVTQLKERIVQSRSATSLFSFGETIIAEFIEAKKIGTARVYEHSLRTLRKFLKGKDLSFQEFNLNILQKFERNHLSKGNTLGGLSVYLRTLRALYRKAIQRGT